MNRASTASSLWLSSIDEGEPPSEPPMNMPQSSSETIIITSPDYERDYYGSYSPPNFQLPQTPRSSLGDDLHRTNRFSIL